MTSTLTPKFSDDLRNRGATPVDHDRIQQLPASAEQVADPEGVSADWTKQAVCKGLTHVFFGPAAERPERRVEREAIAAAYCMSCPVTEVCRNMARLNREHGFWGSENDEQRAAAGYPPRSPSRRSVVKAREQARAMGLLQPENDHDHLAATA